jgi:hypothetical protein
MEPSGARDITGMVNWGMELIEIKIHLFIL